MNSRKVIPFKSDGNELTLTGFDVRVKLYSQIRSIMAELGQSDTLLLRALRDGHGIVFDSLHEDPGIYFTVSSQQLEKMKENGITNPTLLQLLGTSECFALTEEGAIEKFRKLKLE